MSFALQVALFLACIAVVLFVSLLIPLAILFYRRASNITRQLEEIINGDLKKLIQDSQTMVQNINLLSTHTNRQLDELDKVTGIVLRWSERANHIVEEVGALAEVPLINAVRNLKVLRQTWKIIVGLFGEDSRQNDHKTEEVRDTDSPQNPKHGRQ